ncbi:MAG: Transcription elongation factor GreA, partial [uncultured Thermomicrobiales bacterium]
ASQPHPRDRRWSGAIEARAEGTDRGPATGRDRRRRRGPLPRRPAGERRLRRGARRAGADRAQDRRVRGDGAQRGGDGRGKPAPRRGRPWQHRGRGLRRRRGALHHRRRDRSQTRLRPDLQRVPHRQGPARQAPRSGRLCDDPRWSIQTDGQADRRL